MYLEKTSEQHGDAARMIEGIHGEYSCSVVALEWDPAEKTYKHRSHLYARLQDHIEAFSEYEANGLEPFVVGACTDDHGYADGNVTHTWSLSVKLAGAVSEAILQNPLVGPQLVSGSHGGEAEATWVLDRAYHFHEIAPVLKGLTLRLGGDLNFARRSQLLRLPGFRDHRHGTVSRLTPTSHTPASYTVDFLRDAYDVNFIVGSVRAAVPRFNERLEILKNDVNTAEELALDVESALVSLLADGETYSEWETIMRALVPLGEAGEDLAARFTRRLANVGLEDLRRKWPDFQSNAGSVATLLLRAQRRGWRKRQTEMSKGRGWQQVTPRAFGRLIAEKINGGCAVTESYRDEKRRLHFLAWRDGAYVPMSEVERRLTVEQAGKEVVSELTELPTTALSSLVQQLGSNRSLNEVCEHVADDLVQRCQMRVLSNTPYFAVANGILNLITQDLVPSEYFPIPPNRRSPVKFDPAARAPLFERVVNEVFEGDKSLIRYFYALCGYAMFGKPEAQIFAVLYGPSSGNGKSTLWDAVQHVFGTYAVMLPTSAIMTKSHVNDGATPSLARLEGARLATVSEPNKKHALDCGLIKQLTGDRRVPVRGLYSDGTDMLIQFVLTMLTNVIPHVPESEHGMWRRFRIIPFNRKFSEDEADKSLPEKLRKEDSGILNLFLAGLRDYVQNGLVAPDKVLATNAEQRNAVDPLAVFIADTMLLNVDDECPLKIIYRLYETWAKQNPEFSRISKRAMSEKLKENFSWTLRGNLPYFHGLRPIEMPD